MLCLSSYCAPASRKPPWATARDSDPTFSFARAPSALLDAALGVKAKGFGLRASTDLQFRAGESGG